MCRGRQGRADGQGRAGGAPGAPGPGEKLSRKKEAVVTAVYTIAPQRPDGRGRDPRGPRQGTPAAPRPGRRTSTSGPPSRARRTPSLGCATRPSDATPTTARNGCASWTARRASGRSPWPLLPGFTFILDLFHVLEYLWKAAYVFHPEGSPEAEAFVRHRLRMLLEGKVGYVIGGLRQMLTKHDRNPPRRPAQDPRQSHRLLRAQPPMDALRRVPRGRLPDRLRCGRRRLPPPGQRPHGRLRQYAGPPREPRPCLKLRAVHLNGDWDAFWAFHHVPRTPNGDSLADGWRYPRTSDRNGPPERCPRNATPNSKIENLTPCSVCGYVGVGGSGKSGRVQEWRRQMGTRTDTDVTDTHGQGPGPLGARRLPAPCTLLFHSHTPILPHSSTPPLFHPHVTHTPIPPHSPLPLLGASVVIHEKWICVGQGIRL